MELPLQITSHDFGLTPGLEAEIRERADPAILGERKSRGAEGN